MPQNAGSNPAFSTLNNIGNTAYSDNMNQWLSLLLMSGFVLALGMKKRLNKIKALFKEGALSLKISIIFSLIVILRGMFCLP